VGQETGKGERDLKIGQLLKKRENPFSSRRPLHEGETAAHVAGRSLLPLAQA